MTKMGGFELTKPERAQRLAAGDVDLVGGNQRHE